MADGKIYIIVTDQLPNGQGPVTPDKTEKKEDKESAMKDFAAHKFFNFIQSQSKQVVNYTISNIGNFTGNYIAQDHVNDAMNFINFGVEAVTAAIAGAKYGGVYGAVVAAGAVIATKAITTAEQYIAGAIENDHRNRIVAQLRSRGGANALDNGSRGTEY